MGPKTDPHCKLNDDQIATIAIMAAIAISFYGNQAATYGCMQGHYGVKMIDKSGFNRPPGYRKLRFSNCAFRATITVLALISTAPRAGLNTK